MKMFGIILIALGVICFAVPSFTFFTQERVADAGFFHIDMQKPHTIILNPAAGLIMVVAGIAVLALGKKSATV